MNEAIVLQTAANGNLPFNGHGNRTKVLGKSHG
jgi:hypothetical protein